MARKPPPNVVPMLGITPAPDDEKRYERLIRDTAKRYGWICMKVGKTPVVNNGRKFWITATSVKGWPDLSLIHPLGYFLQLEVKAKGGSLKPEQRELLGALQKAADRATDGFLGAYAVWPKDWIVVERMLARPTTTPAPGGSIGPVAIDQEERHD